MRGDPKFVTVCDRGGRKICQKYRVHCTTYVMDSLWFQKTTITH